MTITYEKLRAISAELARNCKPVQEVIIWPAREKPPANERHLVSRNKREGFYGGKAEGRRVRAGWDFCLARSTSSLTSWYRYGPSGSHRSNEP